MSSRDPLSPVNPLSRLVRERAEEVDGTGNRTVRHFAQGASLTSRVDRQGRLLRQELTLDTEVLIWQHGTRVRTGICPEGETIEHTQYDASPSRTRLERARLASQAYRGPDKYINHLARVIALSAGLSMGGAEIVTHSDGGKRRLKHQEQQSQRTLLLVLGAVLAATVVGLLAYLMQR